MAAPSYVGNGGVGASDNSATVAVPFPTLLADDILILQLLSAEADTHQQPTGFSALGTQVTQGSNQTSSWWYKRAVGTESGNLTCSRTNSGDAFFGIMSNWRGASTTANPPFEYAGPTSGNSNTYSSSAITPTYDAATVICLCNEENNIALGLLTDYATEAFDVANTTGDDVEFNACYIRQTTKAAVAAKTGTITNAQSWATITLALWSVTSNTIHFSAISAAATTTASAAATVTRHLAATTAAVTTTAAATLATASTIHFAATVAAVSSTGGGASKNLWPNADLEAGVDDWNGYLGSPEITQSSTQKWEQTYSCRISQSTEYGGVQSDVKSIVSESTQYTASIYLYPEVAITFNFRILDQGENELNVVYEISCPADQWTRLTNTFTTGAGDTGISFLISKNTTEADYWYLDAVQVELGASATAWENYGAGGGAALSISDHLAAAIAAGTTTAAPGLAVTRHLAATAAVSTVTADASLTVTGAYHFACTVAAESTTAAGALNILRHLAAVTVAETVTATPALAVERDLAATVAAETITADATLANAKHLAPAISAETTTAACALAIARPLAATAAAVVVTADANLTVTGIAHFAASVVAATTTSSAVLGVVRHSSATAAAAATTASASLAVSGTYYVRADGSATKVNATGPRTNAAACMNMATQNASTFAPGDTIYICDDGGDYRWDGNEALSAIMEIVSSGSSSARIVYEALGTPIILGSRDLTGAAYKWTASGSGTNEYYCEAAAGGDPDLVEGDCVWMDGTRLEEGVIGSLADHEWVWGDNDTLGYNTFYVRDDTGDPDTSGVVLEGTQRGCVHAYQKSYVTVDGLTVKYGNGLNYDGGFRFDETSYCTIQNCEAHHNRAQGISLKGDYGVIDNCNTSYNGAHNISCGGAANDNATYMEVKNCTAHHSYTMLFIPDPFDGYGIKFLYVDYSSIHNNTVYANAINNIDLDGDGTNPGCRYNDVYENKIYNGDITGIMIELRSTNNKIYRNLIYDNGTAATFAHGNILIWHGCANNEIFGNVIYRTNNDTGGNALLAIGDYEDTLSSGTKVYNNTFDGGGYSTNLIGLDSSYATATDVKIKGNIFYGSTGAPIWTHSSSYTGFESDYNCFNRSGGTIIIRGDYEGYTKATHCSGFSQDCNSVDSDPLFKDAANNKYYLTSASPCINVSVNLGATYDDGIDPHISPAGWPDAVATLDQDSWGTGWEIGAYVYDYADVAAATVVGHNATVILGAATNATLGTIVVTGYNAVVTVPEGVTVDCTLGTIVGVGFDPAVAVSEIILATTGAVTATAFDASITLPQTILVASGAVTVTALQPEVEVETEVEVGAGVVTVTGYNVALTEEKTILTDSAAIVLTGYDAVVSSATLAEASAGAVTVTGYNVLINEQTAVAASLAPMVVTGYDATLALPETILVAAGAVSVVGHNPTVSIILEAVPATLGTVTVLPVSPAFAMKDWKRTKVDAQNKVITLLGKAASIIAPVFAATLGTITVTAHAAEIHEEHIEIACTLGTVAVSGFNVSPHIVGVDVAAAAGLVKVIGYDAVGEVSAIVKSDAGAVTVTGHHAVVAKTPVWATHGAVNVTGINPAVVAPLVPGESLLPAPSTPRSYITNYQEWATHFPAEVARRWRQFLIDTFFIATPPTDAGGTANSIELTTDVEITQITVGQSVRFIAAFTNTGGTVLDVNNIGPQSVTYEGEMLQGGEIAAGGAYTVVYDGRVWSLTTSSRVVIGRAARTWLSTDQELTHDTFENIVWSQTALYDDDGYFYHGGGGIESIIIPANGRYKINAMVIFYSPTPVAEFQVRTDLLLNGAAIEASRVDGRVEEGENTCGVHLEYTDIFEGGDEIILRVREWNDMSANAYANGNSNHRNASWWAIERLR